MLFEQGSSLSGLTPSLPRAIERYFVRSVEAAGHALAVPSTVVHSICEAPKPGTRITGVWPQSSGLVACRPHTLETAPTPKIRSSAVRLTACGAASHVVHLPPACEYWIVASCAS